MLKLEIPSLCFHRVDGDFLSLQAKDAFHMVKSKRTIGQNAERQAEIFLQRRGLKLLERNYRSRFGEIDLIMRERDALIFVEVRSRQLNNFGTPAITITYQKQQKLLKTAQIYLQRHDLGEKISCRFDVIEILGVNAPLWIKNAF